MGKTISDIALLIGSGITPLRSNSSFWNSRDIPWIKTEQLGEYKISDANEYISETAISETNIRIWPPHTVSVAMYGEGKTRGSVSIIMLPATTNQACCNIVVNPEKADYRFLYYWLKNNYEQLRTLAAGVRKNLNSDDIKGFPFPSQGIQEQKQIADVLSTLDDKIQNNNKLCSELESMAKTIYDYWFTRFDFPNAEGKPYRSSGGKMVWNEQLKREIPKGWKITTVGDITICHDSERIPVNGAERDTMKGGIPYYGATCQMGSVDRAIFNGDYVLMAEDGSVMDADGFPNLQRISGPAWVNNHAHVLEPAKGYSCRLLMLILKQIPVVMIKTGSIQMKINQENMNSYKIVAIPAKLIEKVNNILQPIDTQIIHLQAEYNELSKLRDWLLPMLMNGQATIE